MIPRQGSILALGLAGMLLFQCSAVLRLREQVQVRIPGAPAAVVLPAAVQVFLYAGDRYLAANIEQARAAMSGGGLRDDEVLFRVHAHRVVSQLNPCHADNYWIGNAELTWGGAHDQGSAILRRAMECRFWDEWPAFFYGFNKYFFERDVSEARRALEIAAERADAKNAAAYRNLSVMLLAGQTEDARLALDLVRSERDKATDSGLRKLLEQRALRLEGLVLLRRARADFEARFGRKLVNPEELLEAKIIEEFPQDPLKLGYEFKNGEFHLRRLRHEGLERLR